MCTIANVGNGYMHAKLENGPYSVLQIFIEKMGLTKEARGATTAFVREDSEGDDVVLNVADQTLFRQVAARANYLSLDRPDVQFAVK